MSDTPSRRPTSGPTSSRSVVRSSSSRQALDTSKSNGNISVRSEELDPPMLEATLSRKRAEKDLQLLANRIALLRTEEQKAMGKINETQARAKEILEIKRRNETNLQERFSHTLQREMAIKTSQDRATMEREMMKNKLSSSKKIIEDNKRLLATEKKLESKRFEEMNQRVKLEAENEKRKKAEEEKKRKEIQRRQREKEREDKERAIQIEYDLRIEKERQKKEEAESLIDVLEREERELIDRLKRAQEMQQKAYTTLQQSFES